MLHVCPFISIFNSKSTIIILFDRDTAGVKYLRKMSLKTGLEGMLVHKKFKAKDISDAVKLNGFETIKDWLYESIGIDKDTKQID